MLYWTVTLFTVALVAGVLGFGGAPSAATGVAKVLCAVFLVAFAASLLVERGVL